MSKPAHHRAGSRTNPKTLPNKRSKLEMKLAIIAGTRVTSANRDYLARLQKQVKDLRRSLREL